MSDEFEPTERSRTLDVIRESFNFPVVGEVVEVFPHSGNESRPSNHEVDVVVPPGSDPDTPFSRVPVAVPSSGIISTPRVGDKVLLTFPKGGEDPVVVGTLYADKDEDRAPEGDEGVLRATRGNLYLELAPDGSTGRIARKSEDTATPNAKVEIAADGSITIETDGDITVSAGGDVVIDEGGSSTPVAKQGHTHDFSYNGGGDNSSSLSGTTNQPNESGTETEIE